MKVQVDICETKEVEQSNGDIDTESIRLYSDVEDWNICDTTSDVYKAAMREYGRCSSKVYRDKKDGQAQHTGWVFQKRVKYADCNKTYLQETWIVPLKKHGIKTIVKYALS